MQVDPIKPVLKAPGTKCSILKYDQPLSNFAFKFNLRRCTGEEAETGDPNVDFESVLPFAMREFMPEGLRGGATQHTASPSCTPNVLLLSKSLLGSGSVLG